MKILVLNSGSSTVKFKLFDGEKPMACGLCDSIGLSHSKIKCSFGGKEREENLALPDHKVAFEKIIELLREKNSLDEVSCIAHRVVHGGEKFKNATLVNKQVVAELKKLVPLAPMHNPPNIVGIKLMLKLLPKTKNVAVFDTGYHSSIPKKAFLYGLPYQLYKKYQLRRFGFHGTSHKYVTAEAMKMLETHKTKMVSCHLGNGSSITASQNMQSVDTSMGFTPLEGLVMGTRSGSIDPAIVPFLMEKENLGTKEIGELLNKKSGLLGLSKLSPDMRILLENYDKNELAKTAVDVFCYTASKYVGAYAAALNGIDAIVFTAGIGENSPKVREKILQNLTYLGIRLDNEKNKANQKEISSKDSKTKLFVIKTNEELQMARETIQLLAGLA